MKINKNIFKNIPIIAIAIMFAVHLAAILIYTLGHIKTITTTPIMTYFSKEIYQSIWNDPNGKFIFQVIAITVSVLVLFFSRESIFEKKYIDDSEFGLHGTARFQEAKELRNGKVLSKKAAYSRIPYIGYKKILKTTAAGIIVGKIGKKLLVVDNDSELDNLNVMMNGPSGKGKGQTYVIPNIVNKPEESGVVIDVKRENFTLTHQIKLDQGCQVGEMDFVEFNKLQYNCLDYVRNDEEATKLARVIATNALPDSKRDFFPERAEAVFRALIIYVKTHYSKEEASIPTLIDFYDQHIASPGKYAKWVEEQIENETNNSKGVAEIIKLFQTLTGKTRDGVTSSFDSLVQIFRNERIREMTKRSTFNFKDLVEQKYWLYVSLQVPKNQYTALTGAFFTQMFDELFLIARSSPISELPQPVNVMLDEKKQIGKIDGFPETLSLARSYLIRISHIWQDASQGISLYGKEGWREIMANSAIKIVLGAEEKETRSYFSDLFGTTTVMYYETQGSKNSEQKKIINKRALVTDNELSTMGKNTSYVLLTGYNVMKVQKSYQHIIYGKMITKRKKYNYDHFRKKLLDVDAYPVYESKARDLGIRSYEEVYEEENNVWSGYIPKTTMPEKEHGFWDRQSSEEKEYREILDNQEIIKQQILSTFEDSIKNQENISEEKQLLLQKIQEEKAKQQDIRTKKDQIISIHDRNLKYLELVKPEAEKIEVEAITKNYQDRIKDELLLQRSMMKSILSDEGQDIVKQAIVDIRGMLAVEEVKEQPLKKFDDFYEDDETDSDSDDDFFDDDFPMGDEEYMNEV